MPDASGAEKEEFNIYWEIIDCSFISENTKNALSEAINANLSWSAAHDARELLKEDLFGAQHGQCAYCRRTIDDELGLYEIDHVLPKSPNGTEVRAISNVHKDRRCTYGYDMFRFSFENLVLVCKKCNSAKGTFDCRIDRSFSVLAYPDASDLRWVHPHKHAYSDHIFLFRGFVYIANNSSPEGEELIKQCKLDKIGAIERRKREKDLRRSGDVKSALIRLISHLDQWTDAQVIDFLTARFDQTPEKIQNVIKDLRAGKLSSLEHL